MNDFDASQFEEYTDEHGQTRMRRRGNPHASDAAMREAREGYKGWTGASASRQAAIEAMRPSVSTDAPHTFVIEGVPVGKPRQTQQDKWKKRPTVMRYRAWADKARLAAIGRVPALASELCIVAYLPIPKSYSKKKQAALRGQPHTQKPDFDNLLKSAADALFQEDKTIWRGSVVKYWDDGQGARLVVTVR